MTDFSLPMQYLMIGVLIVLALLAIFALIYGILSHRFTDKIVAANMIGSLSINLIVVFAIFLGQDYILDIGIVLALLSFLAVIVLCRVVTDHIFGQLRHMRDKQTEELSKSSISTVGTQGPRVARPSILDAVQSETDRQARQAARAEKAAKEFAAKQAKRAEHAEHAKHTRHTKHSEHATTAAQKGEHHDNP